MRARQRSKKRVQTAPQAGRTGRNNGRATEVPAPTEQLIGYLAEIDLRVGELALALREIVFDEAPGANECVYKSYVVCTTYSLTGRYVDVFCHIAVYPRHVNLGFNRGAELEDPDGLLIGSGKIIRHLKVAGPDDLRKPQVRRFIRAAIKHSKANLAERPPKLPRRSAPKATARKPRPR